MDCVEKKTAQRRCESCCCCCCCCSSGSLKLSLQAFGASVRMLDLSISTFFSLSPFFFFFFLAYLISKFLKLFPNQHSVTHVYEKRSYKQQVSSDLKSHTAEKQSSHLQQRLSQVVSCCFFSSFQLNELKKKKSPCIKKTADAHLSIMYL